MRISRAMSCERGSKRPRMHSDIEDANDMYNGVVEESVHVGGTSFHSDDEVGEGVACVDADELNVEECGTESSTSATEDTSDDESDDEWFFFLDDMFLLVADCISEEARNMTESAAVSAGGNRLHTETMHVGPRLWAHIVPGVRSGLCPALCCKSPTTH